MADNLQDKTEKTAEERTVLHITDGKIKKAGQSVKSDTSSANAILSQYPEKSSSRLYRYD